MKLINSCLVLICLASAGMAQDVRYNFAKGVDFNQFKTYRWGVSHDEEKLDQLTDSQIRSAIDAEMAKKGYTRTAEGRADLLFVYDPSTRHEKQFTMVSNDWGYGRGWGRRWYFGGPGPMVTTGQTSTIQVGEVALDIYGSANHELIWRGVASKTLDPNMKPDKWQKTIQTGAQRLLKNFPPPAK